eukprot:1151847-Pelagomonas_calceolata.AAC.4
MPLCVLELDDIVTRGPTMGNTHSSVIMPTHLLLSLLLAFRSHFQMLLALTLFCLRVHAFLLKGVEVSPSIMLAPYPEGVPAWANPQLEAEYSYLMECVSKVGGNTAFFPLVHAQPWCVQLLAQCTFNLFLHPMSELGVLGALSTAHGYRPLFRLLSAVIGPAEMHTVDASLPEMRPALAH